MARGEVHEAVMFVVSENPDKTILAPEKAATGIDDCCFILPLFGDTGDTDSFKNDRTGFFRSYPLTVTAVDLLIQKCVNDTFVTQHTIVDNTYGTFSSFGTFTANGRKYVSIYIDWTAILSAFGEGIYQIATDETNILASLSNQSQCSFAYRLQNFTADRANRTVRIDTVNNNILGDPSDQKKTTTFPTDWNDGIRIPAWFGSDTSDYEEERTRYNDGFLQFLKDDQTEKYVLDTDRMPSDVHKYLKTNVLQANTILITDYNTDNANEHVNTQVVRDGGYEPQWSKRSKLAKVSVEFKSAFDNMRKLNC